MQLIRVKTNRYRALAALTKGKVFHSHNMSEKQVQDFEPGETGIWQNFELHRYQMIDPLHQKAKMLAPPSIPKP